MKDSWDHQLRDDLNRLEEGQLRRERPVVHTAGRHIEVQGQRLLNLGGNDYLALSRHPRLLAAVSAAAATWGAGTWASPLTGGYQQIHERLERRFAAFKGAEAGLFFPTGYTANMATITTLAGPRDVVCLDKLNHASLVDAARASGAKLRVYPHGNLSKLSHILQRQESSRRCFIVTDSVFSMDGDVADLPRLCGLADRHEAILIVDEAHGTGVLGDHGGGLCEQQGVADRVDVVISTTSKALGVLGGVVTSTNLVVETLINRGRPYMFSTSAPATQAAAIDAALDVLRDEGWRMRRLRDLSSRVRVELDREGMRWIVPRTQLNTPIIPIVTGSVASALSLASHLRNAGIFAPAIRPPSVSRGASRVRLSLRSDLEDREVDQLLEAVYQFPGHRSADINSDLDHSVTAQDVSAAP